MKSIEKGKLLKIKILLWVFLMSPFGIILAQEEDSRLDLIEAEIDKEKVTPQRKQQENQAPSSQQNVNKIESEPDPEKLSDLKRLNSFSEVSVVQRRFMPKSKRVQFFGGGTWMTNDPWFWDFGLTAGLSYNFIEALGIEVMGSFLTTSSKDSVKDLETNNTVSTSSIIVTKGYTGMHLLWIPVYGKMSLMNKRIIPFDLYISVGGGTSSIEGATESTVPTFHGGLGQIFALSKSFGFRWDITWNYYTAKSKESKEESSYSNLLLTFGANYYIPEVKYR